jgi:AcrR family transcriptional regulator
MRTSTKDKNIHKPKSLGRPRQYDAEQALRQALEVFWHNGYANTSLDLLAQAMNMNRPSIYAAFGNKHELYLQAVAHYRARIRTSIHEALFSAPSLREALHNVYTRALKTYAPDGKAPLGCFLISTATTEAAGDTEIQKELAAVLRELDQMFAERFQRAIEHEELDRNTDPSTLAQMATSLLYSLSIKARSGIPKPELEALVASFLTFLCL